MRGILSILLFVAFSLQYLFAQNVSKKTDIVETYKGESYYMHFVVEGETVQSLAQLYEVTNVEILRANPEIASGLVPNKIVRIPVKSSHPFKSEQSKDNTLKDSPYARHVIQPKETWYGISRQYMVPVKDLLNANPGVDTLRIGMTIQIPKVPQADKVTTGNYAEHVVKPQETLYSLTKKYSITVEELTRLNPAVKDGLKVGQILMVPALQGGDAVEQNNAEERLNNQGENLNNQGEKWKNQEEKVKNQDEPLKIQVKDTSYIEHEVARKETLYSISRQYGVDINDILKANPNYSGNLRKGDILRIPTITKKIRVVMNPDTVIMGRAINKAAIETKAKQPCIKTSGENNKVYNVALLVPLMLELADSISVSNAGGLKGAHEYVSFDFIQFYEGAMIAADSMASLGMKVKIHVFDADHGDNTGKTRSLIDKNKLREMDLIIGPFFAESFDLVAGYAKQHEIPIINPLSRRSELTEGNEYIFKLQPSGWSQYNALTEYVANNHKNDNIILVRRNKEENSGMAEVIKTSLNNDSMNTSGIKEVIYSVNGWSGIQKNLSKSKTNLVIITTNDKAVLPALLRDLAEQSNGQNISVIGLPEWEELELDYNYLMKLNTHFFKPWFVDYSDKNAKHFLRTFRTRYIAEPEIDKYAFLGYDATLYFLRALNDYGNGFQHCLESANYHGLSNDFRFSKTNNGGFENQGTAIYKYADFSRVKLN